MMYGPDRPPDYPRASSSPVVILLVSGLTGLVGFLIGFVAGFGATETAAEPLPRMTMRMDPPAEPATPPATAPAGDAAPSIGAPPGGGPSTGGPSTGGPPVAQSPGAQPPFVALPSGPSTALSPSGAPLTTGAPAAPTPSGPVVTALAEGPAGARRTLLVGVDIQPGTYRTSGPVEGQPMCYWARLRGTAARAADVIAADMPRGPATVVIAPTDKAFQTYGCTGWTRA
ncbi:hypothetical protein [Nonomuraea rhodomycinica]|uniref:Uncharacterized protein n=1 Tax=Nonomuraea rhodomycinica TaxID=1712872 RepID=A0A7Y6IKY9_9ACTN|nr:hypothetical protein [Nonomuraea rhodomycinica]NUW39685.1 hypothetical protein [Nonomuraea rhodomycinica]